MKLTKIARGALVLYVAMMVAACDGSTSASAADNQDAAGKSSGMTLVNPDDIINSRLSSSSEHKASSSSVGQNPLLVESSSSVVNVVRSSSSFSFASCGPKVNWKYLNPDISYGEIVDDRDDQVYKTVKIENQEWMAENLNFVSWRSKCDSNEYGGAYIWSYAMDSAGVYSENGKGCGFGVKCTPVYPVRGICPAGWHLPTAAEWDTLFDFVADSADRVLSASIALRSSYLWHVNTQYVGLDSYGFCVLPSHGKGGRANFWTSEENIYSSREAENAYVYTLHVGHNWKYADPYVLEKVDGLAVRCVKD